MTDDQRVDVLHRGQHLADGLCIFKTAAAVVSIDDWSILPREHVAGLHHSQRRVNDPGIAVRMATAEVVQIDAIFAAADRHLVLESLLWQESGFVALEGVHLFHVGLGVLVGHKLDGAAERFVTAGVVPVRVSIDDRRYRLMGDGLDLVEDDLAPSGQLGVRSEEHTSELQSLRHLVCRLLLEKKKKKTNQNQLIT